MMRILILFVLIVCSVEREISNHDQPPTSLGTGFYMPTTSIIRTRAQGMKIFDNIPQKCLVNDVDPHNKVELHLFHSAADFDTYAGQALDLQIDHSLAYNFYTTLVDVSGDVDPELRVIGAAVEMIAQTNCYRLNPDCTPNLTFQKGLLADFDALKDKVDEPQLANSWAVYDEFIRKYGSHYYKGVCYGAKITYYIFAKASLGYTDRQLTAAACVKFKNANLTFCASFTEQDYEAAASLNFKTYYEVRGGDPDIRANMTASNPTAAEIYRFFMSKDDGEDIAIKVEPVWTLLKRRFLGTNRFARALNMLQYHEGYLEHGCFAENVNGVDTRRFVLIGDKKHIPEYQCQVANVGCRSDDDCHLAASTFWTMCSCYGRTCITTYNHLSPHYGAVVDRRARGEAGGLYEDDNMSCHYEVGPWCSCDKAAVDKWDVTWPTDRSDLGHDIAMYRAVYENLDIRNSAVVFRSSCALGALMVMKIVI